MGERTSGTRTSHPHRGFLTELKTIECQTHGQGEGGTHMAQHTTHHGRVRVALVYYVARTAVGANIYGWVCARYFLARPWAALRLRSSLQLYLHLFILASPELHTHIPGAHLDDPQAQPKQRPCDPKVVAPWAPRSVSATL